MALQQLSFGGVGRVSYCGRCQKPLSNPKSVEAGMGPICRGRGGTMKAECKRKDFEDEKVTGENDDIDLKEALVLQRDGDDDHAIVRTNVPHLVVHHSPGGFEFGYGGSGPADLSLNICQWYLNSLGYSGQKMECFDGSCWSLAWVLHQEFKWVFIAKAPRKGITIPMVEIKKWFAEHITGEVISMYAMYAIDGAE